MTSAFAFPRARVLALAVATAVLAFAAMQLLAARPANTAGAAVAGTRIEMIVTGPNKQQFKGDDATATRSGGFINVLGYSYALSAQTSGGTGGGAGGRIVQTPVTITHVMGPSSPQFLGAAANGERLQVRIGFFKLATGTQYYEVTLTDAVVSEVRQYTSGDNVLEDVSFGFLKMEQSSLVAKTVFLATGTP